MRLIIDILREDLFREPVVKEEMERQDRLFLRDHARQSSTQPQEGLASLAPCRHADRVARQEPPDGILRMEKLRN